MSQMAKCFEVRTPEGKLLADLRVYDVSVVEKESGNGAPKPEAAGNGGKPDPGEEGKKTLLGIDTDGDGVRDDIQMYIYFTYSDDKKLRLGLTFYAKEFQGVLKDANDREAAYDHAIKMARHGECLFYLKGEESHRPSSCTTC